MSSTEQVSSRTAGPDVPSVPPGTRITTPGPLGPWRLSASVMAVAVTSGPQLVAATTSGDHLDHVLGRSLAVATVTWVLLGVIDRMLSHTTVIGAEADRPTVADGDEAAS